MSRLLLKEDADLITKIFRVSLPGSSTPPPARSGVPDDAFLTLDGLAEELESEAAQAADPLARWSDVSARRSLFDRVLFGRLQTQATPTVDFLLNCFVRCAEVRSRKARDAPPALDELCGYILELCVSYTAIALLNPDSFPQPEAVVEAGVARLLVPLRGGSLPPAFLTQLVARMQADGTLTDFGIPIFKALAAEVRSLERGLIDEKMFPTFDALVALVKEKPLAAMLAQDADWLGGAATGVQLEGRSHLGAFFSLSCFPRGSRIAQLCFQTDDRVAMDSDMRSVRMALGMCHNALRELVKPLLKNADAKEPLFAFVAKACVLNQVRAQHFFRHSESERLIYEIDPQRIEMEPPQVPQLASTDGFMINLCTTFLELCKPLFPPGSELVSKIDATYILSSHRLQLDKETKLCATGDDVMYWLDPRNPDLRARYLERMREDMVDPEPEGSAPLAVSTSFGTISEYFFLTMRLLHTGVLSSFAVVKELWELFHKYKSQRELLEQEIERLRAMGGGPALALHEQQLERYKGYMATIKRYCFCYQAQLLDPALLSNCVSYYRLVSRWLVAMAQPPPEGLPLPRQVPRMFAALPEHCMDDIAKFFEHLTTMSPDYLEELAVDELRDFVTLMTTFIGSPRYVKNPYLRATFTSLLRYLVPRTEENAQIANHGSERLAAIFHTHELARRHLAPALMQFFVDIEFTGSHTQAVDKYRYRLEMAQTLKYLWAIPDYQASMVAFSRETQQFVRFVNMLINDSIYSMDEALTKIGHIRETQAAMQDEAWNRMNARERHQRTAQHQQEERHAKWMIMFVNEVLSMMEYLSAQQEVAAVFMLPELVGRIASMLNYFLDQLVGAKSKTLKVQNPEKYNFHPAKLLQVISTIVIQFAKLPEFGSAVVKDERSYDPQNFGKAIKVLHQKMLMPQEGLMALEEFRSRCIQLKEQVDEEEADLGEVPEEFTCAITMEIMEDPVKLPSGVVCDRKNICRHLLSDESDPFSRQRLTVEMLQADTDTKAKIEAFRAERKRAAASSSAAPMDVDSGG